MNTISTYLFYLIIFDVHITNTYNIQPKIYNFRLYDKQLQRNREQLKGFVPKLYLHQQNVINSGDIKK